MKLLTKIGNLRFEISKVGLPAAVLSAAGLLMVGCAAFGPNPGPPSKAEQLLFTTITNQVTVTNQVPVAVPVYATNQVTVTVTNQVAGQPPTIVTNVVAERVVDHYYTNTAPQVVTNFAYTETVSDKTKAGVQAGAGALNMFFPGIGTIAGYGVLGVLGLFGYLRSSKLGNTAGAMGQEIETVLEFVGSMPNGGAYVNALKQFLQQHQAEAGVTQQVLQILEQKVDNEDAQTAAKEISTFIQQLQLAGQTPGAAPLTPFGAKVG